jgi:hypothetical protein
MKFAFAAYGYLLFLFSEPTMGCLQLLFGRNCGLLVGTANGRRVRKKLDLHLVNNLNREATQQVCSCVCGVCVGERGAGLTGGCFAGLCLACA